MQGIIIYKGKYGATQQYAAWLSEDLKLPVTAESNIKGEALKKYDFLVIGTSVYIGKLQIESWLRNNLSLLEHKKIFFFQVAATPVEQLEKRQAYNTAGIPNELQQNCEFYFLPGKMIMEDLSWKDRIMLKMGAMLAKSPAEKKTMLTDYNNVAKSHIKELQEAVKKFMENQSVPIY
jgi:menaquinone-dependent protoporphyrinogen IX oxidase